MQLSRDEFLKVSQLGGASRLPEHSRFGVFATASIHSGQTEPVVALVRTAETDHIVEVIEELSDVREEIVASLQARVEANSYYVSGEQIADMMLRRFLADQTW